MPGDLLPNRLLKSYPPGVRQYKIKYEPLESKRNLIILELNQRKPGQYGMKPQQGKEQF